MQILGHIQPCNEKFTNGNPDHGFGHKFVESTRGASLQKGRNKILQVQFKTFPSITENQISIHE